MPGFTTRPELRGTFGMVATTHWLASGVGMRMLELGGNAFDAAVAAGLTLQVVEPHMNGLGGDLPVIFWSAQERAARVLCAQGPAPAAATIDSFAALGLDAVPATGLLAACVPGAFDGWMTLLRDHGTLSLRAVIEPALFYAERGYPLAPAVTAAIASVADLFTQAWPTSAAVYLPGDDVPAAGSLFGNPALGATYRRLLEAGEAAGADRSRQLEAARVAFASGFVAEAVDAFCADGEWLDSSGDRHGGLLRGDDLARWSAAYEPPCTLEYEGLTVCKTGPWGQGPVFLAQLALLRGFDLRAMGRGSADYVHTLVECAKLAFADREAWYGDPGFADVPVAALLSDAYNDTRRPLIDPAAASLALRPGSPDGRAPALPDWSSLAPAGSGTGEPTLGGGEPTLGVTRPGDTCHIDVADRFGNLVSATPSGGWLQSSPVIPSLGFSLGTRAQMFTLQPDLPNALAPGKRPRTTLSPSLALRNGEGYLAFGTPGGDQQDQWTLQFLLAHLLFDRDLQAAIDAPAFHTTHFPSSFAPHGSVPGGLHLEGRLDEAVIAELRARGHRVQVDGPWSLGRVSAVAREPGGMLTAAANPRGMQGYAVGR